MKIYQNVLLACLLFFALALTSSCNSNNTTTKTEETVKPDSLTDAQLRLPEYALKGLAVANGLQVGLMATEPMLKNPTNIDVDERGRVWVTEAYNYRPAINGNPVNALGDRIVILEDNNGDGVMDTAKVFYQGPELDAPLGICVLGNKVIVSQSPDVWVFYDDNGDDKADRKEILFKGISGEQHDHGVHTFTFGPDGKLYFNMGNAGEQIKDKNGNLVKDQDGDVISQKKYRQGLVLRCNPDGSNVECLGQNFRNPYEVAVDSYGSLWQSDNDDDGNRGTRINYVMEYGNYGYTDEMTGAGWQANRTNVEDSIPLKHWHLNDPGVVPNMLQTFAGSPTGMLVYEGSLLPKEYKNQLIHADPGPNVIRSYTTSKNGAGYNASVINILKNEKDQWFRPSDVCAAPDGSIIVADWYDPGVGGHQAGDQTRGRIYRVAPTTGKYIIAKENYTTADGAIKALQNPNLSVRYHAWNVLQQMDTAAIIPLENLWHNTSADPRMRARAFWVLVKTPDAGAAKYIAEAIKDGNPDLRITGLRAARELRAGVINLVAALINDPDPQVRRECLIALHHNKDKQAPALWATLAMQYDGTDRWYLEALGIGADNQWDAFFGAFLDKVKDPLQTPASTGIVWRARTDKALPYLASLASNSEVVLTDRLKYFRAFDFNTGALKARLLLKMIKDNDSNGVDLNKLVLQALDIKTVQQSAAARKALTQVLTSINGTNEYIELMSRYEIRSQNNNLLQLALSKPNESVGRNAAGLLLRLGGSNLVMNVINGKDSAHQDSLLYALARVGSKASIDILQNTALSAKYPMYLRKSAAHKIGNSGSGEDRVLAILKAKKVPAELVPDVVASVSGAWKTSVRNEAAGYLPEDMKNTSTKPIASMKELAAVKTDRVAGAKVYTNNCATCHIAGTTGYDFGPGLTEIGTKLPQEALLEAIVHPSAGIAFSYEGWEIKMKDGSTFSGILASKTETDIEIKFPGAGRKQIKTADVLAMTQMKTSMMPGDLAQRMSTQELADLLGYLEALKKK